MGKKSKWTDDDLIADAQRFNTKRAWQVGSSSKYSTALRRKLIERACAHMTIERRVNVTTDDIMRDALKYTTRSEWQYKSSSFYTIARRRELLEAACAHMDAKRKLWSTDDVLNDAKNFSSRTEWARNSKSYVIAQRRGLLKVASSHMKKVDGKDNDAIYIWKAIGWTYNGEQVYKVGVTSARLDDVRIKQVTKAADVEAEIVMLAKVNGMATRLEVALKSIGHDPKYVGFDGCSEFRAMSDDQLKQALALIAQAAQETIDEESNVASEQE